MNKLLATLLLCLPFATYANDFHIDLPLAAYHLGGQTEGNYKLNDNQLGTGLGLGYRFGDKFNYGPEVMTFKNSWRNQSTFVGGDIGYNLNDKVRLGLFVGVIDGYGTDPTQYKPALAPTLEVKVIENVSANVAYLQSTVPGGHSAFGFNIGFHF